MPTLKTPGETSKLHEARWWDAEPNGKVHCYLCPRHCHIGEGQAGFCFIRANEGGKLYSLGYAHPAALQIDPIEKKPLNHFLPGTRVFSMGTAGCNMGCFFCQNWDISKSRADQVRSSYVPPEDVVMLAIRNGCPVDRVHVQRADDLGRIRDRHLPRREGERHQNGDGVERLHHARSVSRHLRPH